MELKEKIEDYKRRAQNKSLPESAVKVLNEKIEQMEAELKNNPEKISVRMTPDGLARAPKYSIGDKVTEIFKDGVTKGEFTVKSSYLDKKSDEYRYNLHIKGAPSSGIVDFAESQIIEFKKSSKKNKEEQSKDKGALKIDTKSSKKAVETLARSKSSSECDEIIADAKEKSAKRKKSAKKTEAKSDITKKTEAVSGLADSIYNSWKEGELDDNQVNFLIIKMKGEADDLKHRIKSKKI